jgi:hypothetical protein
MKTKKSGKRFLAVFLAFFVSIILLSFHGSSKAQLSMDSPWPMYAHDLQRTNRTGELGPNTPISLWSVEIPNHLVYIAIGQNDILYLAGTDDIHSDPHVETLAAFDARKKEIVWSYFGSANDLAFQTPAIDSNGTIYTGSENYLYAFDPQGNIKWTYSVQGLVSNNTSPAIGEDGTIYFTANAGEDSESFLYALNPDGSLKWRYSLGLFQPENRAGPTISPGGTIYIIGNHDYYIDQWYVDAKVFAVNPDGSPLWETLIPNDRICTPTLGSDGTIYIIKWEGLLALNPDGSEKWSLGNFRIMDRSLATGEDGTIYYMANDYQEDSYILNALNPDNTYKWRLKFERFPNVPASPIIDANGLIYLKSLSSSPGYFWIVSPEGEVITRVELEGIFCMAIGEDQTIYATTHTSSEIYTIVAITTLRPPTNLSYTPLPDGYIQLDWTPSVTESASLYNIYYDNGTGTVDYTTPVATVNHPDSSWVSPWPLDPDKLYKFGVRCEDIIGQEEKNTNTVTVIPKMQIVIPVPPGMNRVRVTLLEASASLTSDIYLAEPQEELLIENSLENVGKIATTELNEGDELVFFVRVHAESWGLGTYDHYSNSIFALLNEERPGTWLISFEDLPEDMADWDFNDVIVLVELLPTEVPDEISTNYLGELEIVTDEGDDSLLIAELQDANGFNTRIKLPHSALTSPASVILTNGDPLLYQEVLDQSPFKATGIFRKIILTNGQSEFEDELAEIIIEYPDEDQNGIVDGTAFFEDELLIYHYDAHSQEWVALSSWIDECSNQIVGKTGAFSLFALGAVPWDHDGESYDGDGSVNDGIGIFGCQIAESGNAMAGILNMIPMVIIIGTMGVARLIRKKARG